MKILIKPILIWLITLLPVLAMAQKEAYYRVRADFSIKEKSTDGRSSLTMGEVFFDKMKNKIVYSIRFPEKEIWLFQDTLMFKVQGGKVEKSKLIPGFIDFSVFNLSLNHNLKDYGLKKSIYSVKSVVKEDNMVISTWVPKKEYSKALGEVKISVVDNKLYGVVFYNPKKVMIGKQLFTQYFKINSFEFPTEIVNFSYNENGQEIHQITTYKNIKVNNWDEDTYNYTIPRK
jgi:hypothetical protein